VTAATVEVRVPSGLGLAPGTCVLRTDPPFADFLAEQMPALLRKDLGSEVATHCLAEALAGPVDGIIAEFGVFRGESINRLAALAHPREIYGFDSFEGLPEPWVGAPQGAFSLKGRLPPVKPNVTLIKGWFEQTLPPFLAGHPGRPVAYLHIDSDLYSSCKTVLQACAPRIVPGTVIVFDEIWNHEPFYRGEMRAFFEFVAETGTRFEWLGHGYDTGCSMRLPGLSGRILGLFLRSLAALRSRPPRLQVAAAVKIL
jgi:hypothetical protein